MTTEKLSWTPERIIKTYQKPLMELLYEAATVHRKNHDPNKVQISTLVSIKTGGCPEDCGYCPQAARYHTNIKGNALLTVNEVKSLALEAKSKGSSRLCMGAAWRNVKDGKEFEEVLEMVRAVNKLDMEVCCTLGMVTQNQARRLAEAGLYAYNHNLDTSENYYGEVISTRAYNDRLNTINNVRHAGVTVCSGGIIGMGESLEDRAKLLFNLASLDPQPESVPINALVAVEGTPMEQQQPVAIWEMVRMIATARLVLPHAQLRLSAGRKDMSDEGQALCFFAGANSIFAGEKLLTTQNADFANDLKLFEKLGITAQEAFEKQPQPATVEAANSKLKSLGEKPAWTRPAKQS